MEKENVYKRRKEKKGQLHLLQTECMYNVFVNLLFVIDKRKMTRRDREKKNTHIISFFFSFMFIDIRKKKMKRRIYLSVCFYFQMSTTLYDRSRKKKTRMTASERTRRKSRRRNGFTQT